VSFDVLRSFAELNHPSNLVTLNYACTEAAADLRIETLPVWESNYVRAGGPAPTRNECVAAHDFRAARGEGKEFRTVGLVRQFLKDPGEGRLLTRDDDQRYYVP